MQLFACCVGPADEVKAFVKQLDLENVFARALETNGVPYHSPQLDPLLSELDKSECCSCPWFIHMNEQCLLQYFYSCRSQCKIVSRYNVDPFLWQFTHVKALCLAWISGRARSPFSLSHWHDIESLPPARLVRNSFQQCSLQAHWCRLTECCRSEGGHPQTKGKTRWVAVSSLPTRQWLARGQQVLCRLPGTARGTTEWMRHELLSPTPKASWQSTSICRVILVELFRAVSLQSAFGTLKTPHSVRVLICFSTVGSQLQKSCAVQWCSPSHPQGCFVGGDWTTFHIEISPQTSPPWPGIRQCHAQGWSWIGVFGHLCWRLVAQGSSSQLGSWEAASKHSRIRR